VVLVSLVIRNSFLDSSSNASGTKLGRDLASYCLGLIETGFSRLPKEDAGNRDLLPHQGSIQDHINLLKTSKEVMQKLIKDKRIQDAATPALLHPDFHKRNIYVSAGDPTVITGVIDWQSANIEPAFIYANKTPDFAALPEESEGNVFENGQDGHKTPDQKEREWRDASLLPDLRRVHEGSCS
jgi:hypothetical protein